MDMDHQQLAVWIDEAQRKIASDRDAHRATVRAYEAQSQRIAYESQTEIQRMMAETFFKARAAKLATFADVKTITVAM